MKLKIYTFVKSIFFVIVMIVAFASCKKDDPDPDFAGTWASIAGTIIDETYVEVKEVVTLSGGKFERIIQVKNSTTNKWVDFVGFKGTLTANGKKLNIRITEAGMAATSPITQLPTGQIEYLKSTDELFTNFMEASETPETYEMEYEVNGGEITFKSDFNSDQDYNDPGEARTYIRQ